MGIIVGPSELMWNGHIYKKYLIIVDIYSVTSYLFFIINHTLPTVFI